MAQKRVPKKPYYCYKRKWAKTCCRQGFPVWAPLEGIPWALDSGSLQRCAPWLEAASRDRTLLAMGSSLRFQVKLWQVLQVFFFFFFWDSREISPALLGKTTPVDGGYSWKGFRFHQLAILKELLKTSLTVRWIRIHFSKDRGEHDDLAGQTGVLLLSLFYIHITTIFLCVCVFLFMFFFLGGGCMFLVVFWNFVLWIVYLIYGSFAGPDGFVWTLKTHMYFDCPVFSPEYDCSSHFLNVFVFLLDRYIRYIIDYIIRHSMT